LPRIRSKLSVSVSKQTLDVLDDILRKKLAKNLSDAVDILANNYLLTQGFGHSSATSDIIEELQANKQILIRDLEATLDDLISAKVEERMAEVQATTVHAEPKPVMPLDELLRQCNATTAEGIQTWATANATLIGTTGNSVDDFVATKVMMVQTAQANQAKLKKTLPTQASNESDAEKWKRLLSEGMVQYWRSYLSNESLAIPARIFNVARAAIGAQKVVGTMNNGGKDEYLVGIVNRLRDDAVKRQWDADAYLKEFKTIYEGADSIIMKNQPQR
jgi:hypothetical protein